MLNVLTSFSLLFVKALVMELYCIVQLYSMLCHVCSALGLDTNQLVHHSTPPRHHIRQSVLVKCNNTDPQAAEYTWFKFRTGSVERSPTLTFTVSLQCLKKLTRHKNNLLIRIKVQQFLDQQKTKGIVRKDFNIDWIFFGFPGFCMRVGRFSLKGFCVYGGDDTRVQNQVFLLL